VKIDIENEFNLIRSNSLACAMVASAMLLGMYGQVSGNTPNITMVTTLGVIGLVSIWVGFIQTKSGITRIKQNIVDEIG